MCVFIRKAQGSNIHVFALLCSMVKLLLFGDKSPGHGDRLKSQLSELKERKRKASKTQKKKKKATNEAVKGLVLLQRRTYHK